MSSQDCRLDGGDNPSAPHCPLTFRTIVSCFSGPKERVFSFFPQHGGPFPGQVGGQGSKGTPGRPPPLLACSWFSLLRVHLRAPQRPPSGGRPWGSSRPGAAMAIPAQTPPSPGQRRALYQPYPGRARHPGSLCWAPGRWGPLILGAKTSTPAKICPAAKQRESTRARSCPQLPRPARLLSPHSPGSSLRNGGNSAACRPWARSHTMTVL